MLSESLALNKEEFHTNVGTISSLGVSITNAISATMPQIKGRATAKPSINNILGAINGFTINHRLHRVNVKEEQKLVLLLGTLTYLRRGGGPNKGINQLKKITWTSLMQWMRYPAVVDHVGASGICPRLSRGAYHEVGKAVCRPLAETCCYDK